jgi:prepilin-type N-terminal cleavage/methylation domain-containing protein
MKSSRNVSGFTLVELLTVIALVAFLLTITATFFASGAAGNDRTSCQTNLHNLHQALTVYMQDYDGNPPVFDPTMPTIPNPCTLSAGWRGAARSTTQLGNLGLLTLYSHGYTRNDPNTNYLRSIKSLHCPEDQDVVNGQRDSRTPQCPPDLNNPAVESIYNLDTLSYQAFDPLTNEWTYSPFRFYNLNNINAVINARANDSDYRRQLSVPASCYDPPTTVCLPTGLNYSQALSANQLELAPKWHAADSAIVTWCMFHRSRMKPFDHDNVLFLDGRVEFLPTAQLPEGTCTNTRAGFRRLPDLERRRECGLP